MKKFLLAIIFTSLLFSGCVSDSSDDKEAVPVGEETEGEVSEETSEGAVSIEITNVIDNFDSGDSLFSPDEGNKYIKVEFTLTANEQVTMNPFYFELETEQSYYSYAMLVENNIGTSDLKKGAEQSYHITFEVPANESALSLVFDDWMNEISFPIG